MNEIVEPVQATIHGWITRLSLLPQLQRLIFAAVFILALLGFVFLSAIAPKQHELQTLRQAIASNQAALAAPEPKASVKSTAQVPTKKARRNLVWRAQQSKQTALAQFSELGSAHQLKTEELYFNGPKPLSSELGPAVLSRSFGATTKQLGLIRQGYVWHLRGKIVDVFSLLDRLTHSAMKIEGLSIAGGQDVVDGGESSIAGDMEVLAKLTFDQYVKNTELPNNLAIVPLSTSLPRLDADRLRQWQDLAVIAPTPLSRGVCSTPSNGIFAGNELRVVFADRSIDAISLAGVIKLNDETSLSSLRAILSDDQSNLAIVALDAQVSQQKYRLTLLDAERVVLQPSDLQDSAKTKVLTLNSGLSANILGSRLWSVKERG